VVGSGRLGGRHDARRSRPLGDASCRLRLPLGFSPRLRQRTSLTGGRAPLVWLVVGSNGLYGGNGLANSKGVGK